jgi:hypothetical protein
MRRWLKARLNCSRRSTVECGQLRTRFGSLGLLLSIYSSKSVYTHLHRPISAARSRAASTSAQSEVMLGTAASTRYGWAGINLDRFSTHLTPSLETRDVVGTCVRSHLVMCCPTQRRE